MRAEAEIAEMQYWDKRKAKIGQEPTLLDQFAMAAPEPSSAGVIKFLQANAPSQVEAPTHEQYENAVCALRYIRAEAMMKARALTNPDE